METEEVTGQELYRFLAFKRNAEIFNDAIETRGGNVNETLG